MQCNQIIHAHISKFVIFFLLLLLPSSHFCIGSLAPRMQCICTFVVHFALLLFHAFYDVSLSHHRPPPTPLLFYCEHSAVQSRRRFLLSPLDYYFSFQPTMKVHTHNTKDYKAKKKGKSEVGGEKIGDDWKRLLSSHCMFNARCSAFFCISFRCLRLLFRHSLYTGCCISIQNVQAVRKSL